MSGCRETTDPGIEELHNNIDSIERDGEDNHQKPDPNLLRCPFALRTESMKQNVSRHIKQTPKYRSTAQSRLRDMTVGDIRYCFQKLRNAGDNLTSEMILYNG